MVEAVSRYYGVRTEAVLGRAGEAAVVAARGAALRTLLEEGWRPTELEEYFAVCAREVRRARAAIVPLKAPFRAQAGLMLPIAGPRQRDCQRYSTCLRALAETHPDSQYSCPAPCRGYEAGREAAGAGAAPGRGLFFPGGAPAAGRVPIDPGPDLGKGPDRSGPGLKKASDRA
ncbi:MAG: hypothetical protein IT372_42495 [Polyangiaceae bacterium]|nr:hypothetical protein [Polyangiaceae bacterium]